jgi:hypothetical protein
VELTSVSVCRADDGTLEVRSSGNVQVAAIRSFSPAPFRSRVTCRSSGMVLDLRARAEPSP